MGKYTTLVRRVREGKKRCKALYNNAFKHCIYIDRNVVATNPHLISSTPLRPNAVDAVAPESAGATPLRPYAIDAVAPDSGNPGDQDLDWSQNVAALFASPPEWLRRQVELLRAAPDDRLLDPTVAAVRLEIAQKRSPDVSPTVAVHSAPDIAALRSAVVREVQELAERGSAA